MPEQQPLVPKSWTGVNDGDSWTVEIEHDRFTETEPWVVTISAIHDDEDGRSETLVAPSPAQAREMAAALLVYAHFTEKANGGDRA